MDEKDAKQGPRGSHVFTRLLRCVGWTVAGIILLVVAIVGVLYVPGVLNRVAVWVLPSVERSSGMRIQVEDISLRWPVRLTLDNALVVNEKDTMIVARTVAVNVNPLALAKGRLNISNAEIRNGFYQMGGADSLYIAVKVDSIGAAASLALNFSDIYVRHADLNGARVLLLMGSDTTETPEDTTEVSPLTITSGPITMRNVDYRMSMALTNDTIAAYLKDAGLSGGKLLVADTIDIKTGMLTMTVDSALYGQRGAIPMAGLDLGWLTLRDATARIDSFKMHGVNLAVPLKSIDIGQVAGMPLQGSGLFEMTDSALYAQGFKILLNRQTELLLSAEMGMGNIAATPVNLDAQAAVYPATVGKAFPAFAPLLQPLPADKPLTLRAMASGTLANLEVDTLYAGMDGIFNLRGAGVAKNFTDIKALDLHVDVNGKLSNSTPFKSLLPDDIKLPPLSLRGCATAKGNNYAAKLIAATAAGRLALDAKMSGNAPQYAVDLRTDSFPVAAFMPGLGVGAVSGTVKADGLYFNPLKPGAKMDADVNLQSIQLKDYSVGALILDARLADGDVAAQLISTAPAADLEFNLTGRVEPKTVSWNLDGNVHSLDFKALGLTDSIMRGRLMLASQGHASLDLDTICADAVIRDADIRFNANEIKLDSLNLYADAGHRTLVTLGNNTLKADFRADTTLMALTQSFSSVAVVMDSMIARRNFFADSLVAILPPFRLNIEALPGNFVNDFLSSSALGFNTLTFNAESDTTLQANAEILSFTSGEAIKVDTLSADLITRGSALLLDVDMHNRPGTLDEFAHVCLKGRVVGNEGNFFLQQQNIGGKTGYKFGLSANVSDSIIGMQLTPTQPIIAYKHWTVNEDNYLTLNPHTLHLHADIDARGDGSRIQIFTSQHSDSVAAPNELTVKVSDIHIQDWLKINPFAPPVAGDVNADLTVNYTTKTVNGYGTVGIENLKYGRKPVGNFNLDVDVSTDFGGAIWANAGLDVNGTRALIVSGALNDTTRRSPLDISLRVRRFPLSVANPFLPADYSALSGTLNGSMDVGGTFKQMTLNGNLNFRNASVKVGMMGSSFRLDTVDIPVASNVVKFNDFAIFGSNDNPLRVNGTVNLGDFASPTLALRLKAKNMQFLDSKKARMVNLYGRGFLDMNADVTGSLSFLRVNADLAILPQTNLTYQITDARAVVGLEPDEDVVRFVNFADTVQVAAADSVEQRGMQMILDANVDIRQGSQFTVDLSADGQNRAQIKPQGNLNYTMTPAQPDGRLTGRITIDGGFFRYSLPVISEKTFTFIPGSYVAFNGPILNPTLHISAFDQVKANVTRTGENSRLVNFDVSLSASGTLEHMDVAFDLSTNNDIAVQNELQSMSATQRANKAMNLLLYGLYSGSETSATANLSGNALYGFLSSQLNKWASNTIKGVDVSFGFDQYDRTRNGQTSTATQYSYKVSKTLFNDRFKIVVGGNYSTDSEESEIAENLISDVSFEYMLNRSGSMYVRLFRHTGYESILEGEVTQTGAGFVVKRRINRVSDIFNFIKAAKQ